MSTGKRVGLQIKQPSQATRRIMQSNETAYVQCFQLLRWSQSFVVACLSIMYMVRHYYRTP